MNPDKIADNLRAIRGARTVEEMAEMLDVTPSSVRNYENGWRIPRDETKMKYAKIAEKSIDEVFYA